MDSRQLHYFRTVVDKGSFTNAAASLKLTQPSLSLSIRKLEEELGTQLLTRGRSGSQPTEAGKYLYQVAARTDMLFDDARRRINDMSAGHYGSVQISSAPLINWALMPEVLRRAIEAHPTVEISLHDPKPSATLEEVRAGRADLGMVLTVDPADFIARHRVELKSYPVCEFEFRLGVPERLRDLPDPVSLADIAGETVILPYTDTEITGVSDMMADVWRHNETLRPARTIETSTLQASIPLVAGNIGCAIMTDNSHHMSGDRITYKTIKEELPRGTALVFHRRERNLFPAAQHLLELVLEVGQENGMS